MIEGEEDGTWVFLKKWVMEKSSFQTRSGVEYLDACYCMRKLVDGGYAQVGNRRSRKPPTGREETDGNSRV